MYHVKNDIPKVKPVKDPAYTVYMGGNMYSVIVPGQTRYVLAFKGYKYFHCDEDLKATKDCSNSSKGFCLGHKCTLQEFLDKFCNSVLPPGMEIKK